MKKIKTYIIDRDIIEVKCKACGQYVIKNIFTHYEEDCPYSPTFVHDRSKIINAKD